GRRGRGGRRSVDPRRQVAPRVEAALRRRAGGDRTPLAAFGELTPLPLGAAALDELEAQLNRQQRAVVNAPAGVALVIAGAGSGKTRVLTARVARLLERGVAPERMLL